MSEIKANRTRNLRYKRPALASLGFDAIQNKLDDISEACDYVHWYVDQESDVLMDALDGNEEEAWEFKMAFADLEAKVYQLREAMQDNWMWPERYYQMFDYCTVALIGSRYRTIGWDAEEEDYLSLTAYEQELAQTEAGKCLMRLTKKACPGDCYTHSSVSSFHSAGTSTPQAQSSMNSPSGRAFAASSNRASIAASNSSEVGANTVNRSLSTGRSS